LMIVGAVGAVISLHRHDEHGHGQAPHGGR
jgi:hypothetical protein